jgi:DNA-binding transcriptional MerR regulator
MIMGPQQASLDFFNTAPEQAKPEEKKSVKPESPEADGELKNTIAAEKEVLFTVDENVREVEFILAEEKRELPVKADAKTVKKSSRGRMKLSDMDVMVGLVEVPEDALLFQKNYYSIGEVSNMFKVNISLIRFWENEFDILKPKKNGKGDRLFRPQDVKNLQLIYHLLREKKYTIDGARDFLKKNKKADETFELIDSLKKTKAFLLDLKANL